jgi:sugar/nucleoside kinase (ribokinase family)
MLQFAEAWQKAALDAGCTVAPPLSLEVEKVAMDPHALLPVMQLCDCVFFAQKYAEAHAPALLQASPAAETAGGDVAESDDLEAWREGHLAVRFLRALHAQGTLLGSPCSGLWFCTWGKLGAFALDRASGRSVFQPAVQQTQVLDSVGAGDTFLASIIHARLLGASASGALRCGCATAGRKVAQQGFNGLASALPSDLA